MSRVDQWAAGKSIDAIVAPYFAEVEAAARSGLFDALGHLDFVKRYVADHLGRGGVQPSGSTSTSRSSERSSTRGPRSRSTRAACARRRARRIPVRPVVARFRELGGERVTAGSDAHRLDWFAHGLEDGYRIVAEAGFEELAFRRGAERVAIALPGRFALA